MSEICWSNGVSTEGEREGERESEAGGLRVEAEDEMPKFKIQMTNDGVRSTTRARTMDTDTGHEHEQRTRNTNSERRGIRATDQRALKRMDNRVPQ